jgi:hypothetical protein
MGGAKLRRFRVSRRIRGKRGVRRWRSRIVANLVSVRQPDSSFGSTSSSRLLKQPAASHRRGVGDRKKSSVFLFFGKMSLGFPDLRMPSAGRCAAHQAGSGFRKRTRRDFRLEGNLQARLPQHPRETRAQPRSITRKIHDSTEPRRIAWSTALSSWQRPRRLETFDR